MGMPPREDRRSAYARGYTKRWARAAQNFRVRHPLCGMRPNGQRPVMSRCFDEDRATPATQTDHVIPHRGDAILFNDAINNWQALCLECHTRKTQAGL